MVLMSPSRMTVVPAELVIRNHSAVPDARALAPVVLYQRIPVLGVRHERLLLAGGGTLFGSLPGAGPVLVPRLIVAFGTRRERYDNAYQMQCYSGIAPVKAGTPI